MPCLSLLLPLGLSRFFCWTLLLPSVLLSSRLFALAFDPSLGLFGLVWFGLAWLARGSGGVSRGQPQARASIPRKLDPFRELWFGVSCLSIYFRVKSQVSKSKSHSINIYLAPASPTIPCVCVSVVHTPSTRLARLRLSF